MPTLSRRFVSLRTVLITILDAHFVANRQLLGLEIGERFIELLYSTRNLLSRVRRIVRVRVRESCFLLLFRNSLLPSS